MASSFLKQTLILMCIPALAACSMGGDWPDLSQPVAGITGAGEPPVRVIAEPASPAMPHSSKQILNDVPESDPEKMMLVSETARAFEAMTSAFEQELAAFEDVDSQEAPYAWNGLQLSLTRISNLTDRLNGLVALRYAPAITADDEMFATVIRLRTRLDSVRPQ